METVPRKPRNSIMKLVVVYTKCVVALKLVVFTCITVPSRHRKPLTRVHQSRIHIYLHYHAKDACGANEKRFQVKETVRGRVARRAEVNTELEKSCYNPQYSHNSPAPRTSSSLPSTSPFSFIVSFALAMTISIGGGPRLPLAC